MIDKNDIKLISILHKDGRENYANIARILGITESTARKRFKRLIDDNFIRIVASINWNKLGLNNICIVGLQINMRHFRVVSDKLANIPSVCFVGLVAGRYDLIVIILARSNEQVANIIEKQIAPIPYVIKTETFIALNIIKGGWPLLDMSGVIDELE